MPGRAGRRGRWPGASWSRPVSVWTRVYGRARGACAYPGSGVAGLGGRPRGRRAATGCCSSVCGSCGFRGVASPEPGVVAQHVRGCDGTSSGRSPRSSLCCCLVGETGEIAASNEPRPMLSPCMLLGYQRSPRRPSTVRSLQSNRLVGTLDGSQEPVNGLSNIACPTPERHRKRGTRPTEIRRWTDRRQAAPGCPPTDRRRVAVPTPPCRSPSRAVRVRRAAGSIDRHPRRRVVHCGQAVPRPHRTARARPPACRSGAGRQARFSGRSVPHHGGPGGRGNCELLSVRT